MVHLYTERTTMIGIAPLDGKYYGTEIVLTWRGDTLRLKVWLMGDRTPSARQLAYWDAPDDDELADLVCDDHYETADGYAACKHIVEAFFQSSPPKGAQTP